MLLFLMMRRPPRATLLPYTTLFRSGDLGQRPALLGRGARDLLHEDRDADATTAGRVQAVLHGDVVVGDHCDDLGVGFGGDRKSTRLNSSHANISYAVFCLK